MEYSDTTEDERNNKKRFDSMRDGRINVKYQMAFNKNCVCLSEV